MTTVKKTYNLDATMIERVRRLFGVKTDTEAIQKALGKAIEDREVEERLDALLKKGRFRTVYRRNIFSTRTFISRPPGLPQSERSFARCSSLSYRPRSSRPWWPMS